MDILAFICLGVALLALVWMGWIDLRLWILPNELVALFALTALPFHFAMDWAYGGWLYFTLGAVAGGGILWVIRLIGNKIYGFETMGLGDIKLLAAAGLWLGPEVILMALAVGAFAGVVHAIILALITWRPLSRMMLPAGPGFIAGILIIGIYTYKDILI